MEIKGWNRSASGTSLIPHAFTGDGAAVCRSNIRPDRRAHFFTLDEVQQGGSIFDAPCRNCRKKVQAAEAASADANQVEGDFPRVGERVHYNVGKATVNATITPGAPDAEGRVLLVDDGDQTGHAHYVHPCHLTRLPIDMEALHAKALELDRMRELLSSAEVAPAVLGYGYRGASGVPYACDSKETALEVVRTHPHLTAYRLEAGGTMVDLDANEKPAAAPTDEDLDECTCIEHCDQDPKTACSLSGIPHVHPEISGAPGVYGPCSVHPGRPGDH
ncbi:hypothetical protein [Streptomyces sp. Midd1]|uniref:hypothetical protein n=1 Tax=Streptomyces sp. Midd3 TaxID=3161191 RepID=UPI0034DB027D